MHSHRKAGGGTVWRNTLLWVESSWKQSEYIFLERKHLLQERWRSRKAKMLKLVWVCIENKYEMDCFIYTVTKFWGEQSLKGGSPPPPDCQLHVDQAWAHQSHHNPGEDTNRIREIKGRLEGQVVWRHGLCQKRGVDPTTKSVHDLPYCELGRGRYQPHLSEAEKCTT